MTMVLRPEDLAAQALTVAQLEAWKLVELHGFSYRRAADELGISRESVRDRMLAARANIRQRQQAEFVATSTPHGRDVERVFQPLAAVAVNLLIERDGAGCYLCGRELIPELLQIEHVIPVSRGGSHDASNMRLACGACNTSKGDKFVSLLVESRRPIYHHP